MRRFLVVVGGAIALGTAVYVARTRGDLPARVPMQYGRDGEVTWYADRARFWWFMLAPWSATALVFLAFAARSTAVAFGFAWVNLCALLVYDLTRERSGLTSAFGLSPDVSVAIVMSGLVALITVAVIEKRRAGTLGAR